MRTMRCISLIVLILSGVPVTTMAQDAPDTAIIRRIKEEAFQHSQVMEIAYHLTDGSGPRLSNSPGLARAQQWVMETLTQWGLSNVGKEAWGTFGKGWELEKDYLAMVSPYYEPLIAYPMAWTGGTGGPFRAEVVLYHPKDSAEQAALRGTLKGKLLLNPSNATIRFPFTPEAERYTDSELLKITEPPKPSPPRRHDVIRRPEPRPQVYRPRMVSSYQFFQQEGAVGLLASGPQNRDGTVFVQGGGGRRWSDSLSSPRIMLAYEDFHQIQRLVEHGEHVVLEGDIETRDVKDDSVGYNVMGEIPGTNLKDQVVIVGGHLDSWQSGTGATDNGAGSAVMMEVIRILKNMHPRRTIRIILWSGEEQGLLGSAGYVRMHYKTDSIARSKVSAYYNLDNGSGKVRGIYLQGDTLAGPLFQRWLDAYGDDSAKTVTWQNTGGTDHLCFVDVGIPGFQFIQDDLEYETRTHHSNMDTYDHLSEADLKQAAAVIATFVYQTAMRDAPIPRK